MEVLPGTSPVKSIVAPPPSQILIDWLTPERLAAGLAVSEPYEIPLPGSASPNIPKPLASNIPGFPKVRKMSPVELVPVALTCKFVIEKDEGIFKTLLVEINSVKLVDVKDWTLAETTSPEKLTKPNDTNSKPTGAVSTKV